MLRRFLIVVALLAQSVCAASETLRDGNWSDPATWDAVPTRADDATIKHAVTVDAHAEARLVTVNAGATLTVASVIDLWGSMVVNGTLEGQVGEIRFHVANDRSFVGNVSPGPDPANHDFHPDDIGLWGMGEVHLTGLEVTPWLNAVPVSETPRSTKYGAVFLPTISMSSATLASNPVGWSIGDTISICSIDGGYSVATLTGVVGPTITFSVPFQADTLAVADASGTLQYARPKVANLSRRFVISSADVINGDSTHRAHTAMMMGGCAQFDYVEFRNLGPRKKLGRYPVHFHKMGDSPCCRVNGCSMWQSVNEPGSRFVSVHDSSSVQVTNNVGLRSRGHGFFSETGNEASNEWSGNLSIEVSSPEELVVKNPRADAGSHHFWLYDGSKIVGNVAVGPKTVVGKVIPASTATVGLILQHNSTGKANLPPPVVSDFEALGTGEYAAWSLVANTKFENPLSCYCGAQFNHDTGFPPVPMSLSNPVFAFNGSGGVSPYRCQLYFNAGNICEHQQTINGGVIVGEILIHAHYHAIANFNNVQFSGQNLVSPAYWQCMVRLEDCGFNVSQLEFHQNYLPHQEEPGLLSIRNGTGSLFGSNVAGLNADFSLSENVRFPGFAGTPEKTAGNRLSVLAPQTGLIARPPTGDKYPQAEQWSVDVSGTPATIMRQGDPLRFVQPAWQSSLAAGNNGYPYGFPPGTYDVRIKQKDGTVKAYLGVTVVAGQVTQMQ